MKTTLIIGASENPDRYSYKAAHLLKRHGHPILNYGSKSGMLANEPINNDKVVPDKQIDTITLYVNPLNQIPWYDFILKTKPNRVIFNPGTENPELESMLDKEHISHEEACTLVLLNTGQY